MIDREIDSMCI